MADKYITLAELRVDPYNINHEKVDNKYLGVLQELTYNLINSVCGQEFEQEGTDEAPVEKLIDGNDKETIFMPKRLISLKKVKIYIATNDFYEYDAENLYAAKKFISWLQFAETPRVNAPCNWFVKGQRNIGVVGVWGWASVPNPIKYLQGKLIKKIIDDKSFANKFTSESVGDFSYNLRTDEQSIFGDAELDLIVQQYRDWVIYGTA